MKLGCQHGNWLDDTTLEFPRFGFWIIHVISCIIIFVLGMKFVLGRVPLPFLAYRLLHRMIHR